MSLMPWLQKLFSSRNEEDELENDNPVEENPFEFGQHVRIVIAMLVVLVSALVMWWILE